VENAPWVFPQLSAKLTLTCAWINRP